ncbi:MFS transporter [Cupriavidus pinatubonensis]|uniref:Sodium:galactoside symporter family protein n=2 Tax=Cupriavidus TaxID=106589 RepID=Q46N50_CUPPJ|nr:MULTISPECIES: MFS transporter [Cupriavidus]
MNIRPASLIAYGALGLPLAMVALPIYVLAPAYYTSRLGMPLSTAGLVLMLTRLVDTVQDPWLGRWADALAGSRRLHPALWATSLCLIAAFAALWMPPVSGWALTAWFAAALVLVYAAHSFMNVAYLAWGASLGLNCDALTRAAAWREGAGVLGVLIASAGPAWLMERDDLAPRNAMIPFIALFAILLIGAVWLLRFAPPWQRMPPGRTGRSGHRGLRPFIVSVARTVLRNPSFRMLLVPYFLNGLSVAIPATLAVFFIEDRLGIPRWVTPSLAIYFSAAALGLPVWVGISRRIGPQRAWRAAIWVAIAAFVWAATLGRGDVVPFLVICVACGFALGADLAIPPVILAQCLPDGEGAGACFGIWTLTGKLCLAISALTLPGLAWLGYVPGFPATGIPGMALAFTYAGLPCLLKLGALSTLQMPSRLVSEELQ